MKTPLCPPSGLPLDTMKASPYLALAVTSHGGHMAFLEGLGCHSWVAKLLTQLLPAVAARADEVAVIGDCQ